jgi:hypothetical protein
MFIPDFYSSPIIINSLLIFKLQQLISRNCTENFDYGAYLSSCMFLCL